MKVSTKRMSMPPTVVLVALSLAALVAQGCVRAYTGRGLVLKVDRPAGTVTVSHDAIAGLMDAMVMPLAVAEKTRLAALKPGDRVRFRLVVRDGRSLVDRLEIVSAAPADGGLLTSPARPTLVPIGSLVPDFALIDQNGAAVSLASLAGKVVAVTFVYTRCPLPEYCPRMVQNFKNVHDRFADQVGRDLALVTITFDPKFDTVETLRAYAETYRANKPGWHFLTGPPEAIRRVCEAFGIEYWPDQGLITHTLQTAVIDRRGRLAATVEGKDYTERQLGDLIEMVMVK